MLAADMNKRARQDETRRDETWGIDRRVGAQQVKSEGKKKNLQKSKRPSTLSTIYSRGLLFVGSRIRR